MKRKRTVIEVEDPLKLFLDSPMIKGFISVGKSIPIGIAEEDSHSECMLCGGQRRSDDPYTGPCRLCGNKMTPNIIRIKMNPFVGKLAAEVKSVDYTLKNQWIGFDALLPLDK